jgi:hypothetical protein
MIASQSALLEGPVGPAQFVEPLRTPGPRRRDLLLLCAVYALAVLGVLQLADFASDGAFEKAMAVMRQSNPAPGEVDALLADRGLVTASLIAMVLLAALSVPFWHAPALVHWGSQGVGQALFSSTLAVWRCRGAFVVYLLVGSSSCWGRAGPAPCSGRCAGPGRTGAAAGQFPHHAVRVDAVLRVADLHLQRQLRAAGLRPQPARRPAGGRARAHQITSRSGVAPMRWIVRSAPSYSSSALRRRPVVARRTP